MTGTLPTMPARRLSSKMLRSSKALFVLRKPTVSDNGGHEGAVLTDDGEVLLDGAWNCEHADAATRQGSSSSRRARTAQNTEREALLRRTCMADGTRLDAQRNPSYRAKDRTRELPCSHSIPLQV